MTVNSPSLSPSSVATNEAGARQALLTSLVPTASNPASSAGDAPANQPTQLGSDNHSISKSKGLTKGLGDLWKAMTEVDKSDKIFLLGSEDTPQSVAIVNRQAPFRYSPILVFHSKNNEPFYYDKFIEKLIEGVSNKEVLNVELNGFPYHSISATPDRKFKFLDKDGREILVSVKDIKNYIHNVLSKKRIIKEFIWIDTDALRSGRHK